MLRRAVGIRDHEPNFSLVMICSVQRIKILATEFAQILSLQSGGSLLDFEDAVIASNPFLQGYRARLLASYDGFEHEQDVRKLLEPIRVESGSDRIRF